MALYMLDTNAVSAAMRGNPLMDERLLQLDAADGCISAVTHSGICHGLALRPEATTLIRAADAFLAVATTLAWDAVAAAAHGRLRAQLRQAGTRIGDFDEMIAAHALWSVPCLSRTTNAISGEFQDCPSRIGSGVRPVDPDAARPMEPSDGVRAVVSAKSRRQPLL
jgi:tRNA(fMet)-specific endonuclease VapC